MHLVVKCYIDRLSDVLSCRGTMELKAACIFLLFKRWAA